MDDIWYDLDVDEGLLQEKEEMLMIYLAFSEEAYTLSQARWQIRWWQICSHFVAPGGEQWRYGTYVSLSVKQGLGAIVIFVWVLQSALVRHFLVSGSDSGESRQETDKWWCTMQDAQHLDAQVSFEKSNLLNKTTRRRQQLADATWFTAVLAS